ncbi:uncharacterized protein IL334_007024 [Kwoniella shivajii]|uniref:SCA7 domain-containing protein n=1 Tax=Kwoniella shivajii TaxID=564305 RepID=A0ABZ1D7K0_9TREE|nr:hypothetical protein IL334_007024 [Kwoniella shivajii]
MTLKLKPRKSLSAFTFSLSPSPSTDLPSTSTSARNEPIPPRPPGDFIPEKDMYMFGTYPLQGDGEIGKGIIRCKRCFKVTMEWAAGEHRRICNHILDGTPLTTKKVSKASKTTELSKKRRASEVSNPNLSPKKRSKLSAIPASVANTATAQVLVEKENEDVDDDSSSYKGLKKSEIRKMEKEKLRLERKEAKEKEKLEVAERKRLRALNPINLDRQCGVINDKSTPCARSLTCKTHTVGAKRAVQGRSRPYDELFIDWQVEHNPNFKVPQKREIKEKEKVKKKKKLFTRRGGEEGLEDDEDGLRELEELINLTKVSGERVKSNFSNLGQPQPLLSTLPSNQNQLQTQVTEKGASTTTAPTTKLPSTATGNGNARPSISGGSGISDKGKSNSTLKIPVITNNITSNNNNVIPFQTIWRSSSSEFASVGHLLTSALAARNKSNNQGKLNISRIAGVVVGNSNTMTTGTGKSKGKGNGVDHQSLFGVTA